MGAAPSPASDPLDSTSLHAIMIRWKLAEQYLLEIPEAQDTGKIAMHVLVSRDFPVLIRELMRLRPDLTMRPEAPVLE